MARKKTKRYTRRASTGKKAAKRYGRKGNSNKDAIAALLGGFGYGAVRGSISNALAPWTSKIPGGQYTDEIAMAALSYFAAKGKIPLLNKWKFSRTLGKAGMMIEAAMLGEQIGSPIVSKTVGQMTGAATAAPTTATRSFR